MRVIEHVDGRSKGFGFVCFEEEKDALKAMEEMNNSELEGKIIHVSIAICQDDESGGNYKKGPRSNLTPPNHYPPYWPIYYIPIDNEYMPVSYVHQSSYIPPINAVPFVPFYPYPSSIPYNPQKQEDPNKMNQTVQKLEKLKL